MTGRSPIPAHALASAVAADFDEWVEPTSEELEAIDAEWPLLAAELAVVNAECRLLVAPDVLARRALRRAHAARNRAAARALSLPSDRRTLKEVASL